MALVLDNYAVQDLLTMRDCIDVLEDAQRELGRDRAILGPVHRVLAPMDPSRVSMKLPEGSEPFYSFSAMAAVLPDWDVAAVRQDSDLINYYMSPQGLRSRRLPAAPGNRFCGLIFLHRASTGELLAVIHDGYLQKTRVGGLAGVAAKYLSNDHASTIAVIGSGWQASDQIEAHCIVRDIRTVRVFSPNAEHRRTFATKMSTRIGIPVEPVADAKAAVEGAHIVAAATNSLSPVILPDWLEPGMFLTYVKELEFHDAVYDRCDVLVANRRGPIWDRYVLGGVERIAEHGQEIWYRWDEARWAEVDLLADVIVGKAAGRSTPNQIAAFMNQGEGLQFAAVGKLLYERAVREGVGVQVDSGLFHQGEEFIP